MPFNTATPKSAMNPTPAEILKGIPLNERAKIPPTADKGMAEKINKACGKELKVKYNKANINNKAIGKAILNLADASFRFSKVPP